MSWQAAVAHAVLRALSWFAPSDPEPGLRERERRGRTGGAIPQKLKGVAITARECHGMTVVRLEPVSGTASRTALYLHGGAYCFEAAGLHWRFLRRLVLDTGVAFEVPLYPLAPADTAATTVPAVAAVLVDVGAAIVMGDSAGGGLALAVAQHVRDQAGGLPERLILIAPWLDVRTADPRQRAMEKGDLMLKVDTLQAMGRMYAGDLALDHPFVAPVLGELHGLPPITLFAGSRDLLCVDAHELVRRCREDGHPVDLIEQPGMQHVYPMIPMLPEARRARSAMATLIRSTPGLWAHD